MHAVIFQKTAITCVNVVRLRTLNFARNKFCDQYTVGLGNQLRCEFYWFILYDK